MIPTICSAEPARDLSVASAWSRSQSSRSMSWSLGGMSSRARAHGNMPKQTLCLRTARRKDV